MSSPKAYQPFIYCMLALALFACQRQPSGTADIPRQIPKTYKISVAPFTQPLNPGQLITGQLPEDQGKIAQDNLLALDMDLRDVLLRHANRDYSFISQNISDGDLRSAHSSGQPGALQSWIQYGHKHNAQLLLVPMVLNWHEREGSQAGVDKSAHVRVEFFLLNIDNGQLMGRSTFEEKQVGLIDNLLGMADFVKRKGQWITARQLAAEGMVKAVEDLGL